MVTKIDITMSDGSRLVLIPGERDARRAECPVFSGNPDAVFVVKQPMPGSEPPRPTHEGDGKHNAQDDAKDEQSEPEPEPEPEGTPDSVKTTPDPVVKKKQYKNEPSDDTDWKTVLNRWVVWYGMTKKKPMTISGMVKAGGMHPADFTKFRKGTKRFSYFMQDKLARFLGVTVDQLRRGPGKLGGGDDGDGKKAKTPKPENTKAALEPNVVVQAIVVKTICDICQKQPDGARTTCDGCPLKRARYADGGPYGISNEYKAQRCLNCARKHHNQCDACRLTQAIYAQGVIDTTGLNGANDAAVIHDAVAVSETRYQAAMTELRERHDKRA